MSNLRNEAFVRETILNSSPEEAIELISKAFNIRDVLMSDLKNEQEVLFNELNERLEEVSSDNNELQDQAQALNKAIDFTIDECDSDAIDFLRLWREGDYKACKEWGFNQD